MPEFNLEIKFPEFRQTSTDDEYQLYRNALEWSLDDPIIIDKREDIKSEVQWKGLVEPYDHQVRNLLTFCRRLPVTLLADDVGLGKTISAGLIASELMARKRITRILVVCPKILGPQWKEELETKFGIASVVATGRDLLNAKCNEERHAVITTYNSARLYMEQLPKDHFQLLVLDEAHKLRNLHGTDSTPQVATKFRSALSERLFKYVLMLTATPIQNRLWDLYSLVDLLSVARGHENPFGIPGMFARNYIADEKEKARKLKLNKKDEFQSIVYGYMSRIRRGDADLKFPDRRVLLHPVQPTTDEVLLLQFLTKHITSLPYLSQIGILKAYTSSPYAVLAFCTSMARNQTAPVQLATGVREIVSRMEGFTKLYELGKLVYHIATERPDDWRVVVFTTSRETQTSIQSMLSEMNVRCAPINGQTTQLNPQTIRHFKSEPPQINVIVSTEAGAEGVNLQAANVLINFDLPWNPMIVEQRIGRIQRLGSKHETVSIYNMVLAGTFDEYIVGRLIEKLHMASHAIGDIEALLETANLSDEEDGGENFEEMIRNLVISSLQGQDVEAATHRIEASISRAKIELKAQNETIESTLGSMDNAGITGPRSPALPPITRAMPADEFAVQALEHLGCKLEGNEDGTITAIVEGRSQIIVVEGVEPPIDGKWTDYRPGASPFDKLAQRISSIPLSKLEITEHSETAQAEIIAKEWCQSLGGNFERQICSIDRISFKGNILARVRAFVAHDSCERVVEIECQRRDHFSDINNGTKLKLVKTPKSPSEIGLKVENLLKSIENEPAINEFCRFYNERRIDEVAAAAGEPRKTRKLEDDFTPRLECNIVGIQGEAATEIAMTVHYKLGSEFSYRSMLRLDPETQNIAEQPEFGICSKSQRKVPKDCLGHCEVTDTFNLFEFLNRSEYSNRSALKENFVRCAETSMNLLQDETGHSDVTGKTIAKHLLQKSALSDRIAERKFFQQCEFSKSEVLEDEVAVSAISGKRFRKDRLARSVLSGVEGDESEFVKSALTQNLVAKNETEVCAISGTVVAKGELVLCDVSKEKVLPSLLLTCGASGTKATREHFVACSISNIHILKNLAFESIAGNYCMPKETAICVWSEQYWHPEDTRICSLSGLQIHADFTAGNPPRIVDLDKMVATQLGNPATNRFWGQAEEALSHQSSFSRANVRAAIFNTANTLLVCLASNRDLLGLRKRELLFCYSIADRQIVGKPAFVKM